ATVTGTSDASVISTGGSVSGGSSSGSGSAFAGVAAPVATKTTDDADKTLAKAATTNDEESDENKKKKAGPVLAKNAGRVTVILPKN
ncbi:MAG TPA: hypothetical protein VNH84_22245, partial [Candidatus Saccharimonadales bacterium]|nr:hypothetical protein [Candidatus Saccharimonadales bacterium]